MRNIRTQVTETQKGRRIVGRILPGSDLLQGVEKVCRDYHIKSAIVVSIIGSLERAEFIYPLPDKSNVMGIRYSDPVRIEGPIELMSCQGVVGLTEDGEVVAHLHAVIGDAAMRVYGGHLLINGNPILGTGEILIQECEDVNIQRQYDEETGFMMFKFYATS
jgi:hypothetical protein